MTYSKRLIADYRSAPNLMLIKQVYYSSPFQRGLKLSQLIYAEPGTSAFHALEMVRPLACRRLEGFPNITATQLFEELCVQFPGRFHPWQVRRLMKRVKAWREDARARGVVIGSLKCRSIGKKPRGRRPGPQRFIDHWSEMLQCLEARPDQTAKELLVEFQARYPGIYHDSQAPILRLVTNATVYTRDLFGQVIAATAICAGLFAIK